MNGTYWKILIVSVVIIAIAYFSPLLLIHEKTEPYLLGMPYSLWLGILVSVILVLLTVLGILIHPNKDSD